MSLREKEMTTRQPRYSKEEFARRGDEIYDRDVRPRLSANDRGKIVAIDIETGAWEIDADERVAGQRLAARCPDAQTWVVRVGSPSVRRFGTQVGRVTEIPASAHQGLPLARDRDAHGYLPGAVEGSSRAGALTPDQGLGCAALAGT
jgi:hypothetical protein